MRKFICMSLYTFLVMISNILVGCNSPFEDKSIPNKTYEDFYDDLINTTIEMEVVIKEKRAIFNYTNNENYFITTIRYENGQEFGFIYERENQILYTMDKGQITNDFSSIIAESQVNQIFQSANYFFYLRLDKEKMDFVESTTLLNRECNKYRYEDADKNLVYNIYIDKETSLCLKCVCSNGDVIDLFFETKKFENVSSTKNYESLIANYINNKQVENNDQNTENEK